MNAIKRHFPRQKLERGTLRMASRGHVISRKWRAATSQLEQHEN